jgi:lysozyme family protein/peptidoglycan hydrolase-like protein with peptidoglycan-binding domain
VILTGEYAAEYGELWRSCRPRRARLSAIDALCDRINGARSRYEAVGRVGVPWYVIGIIHTLEGGGDFRTHLHNGDPLTARTVHVPAGRPVTGTPPFSWEESAADALSYTGLDRNRDWSIPGTLYVFEAYNGFGYRPRGINSPYLWSFSNHYTKGKFVADGRYSATAVSAQCGAAVLMRRLDDRGVIQLDGTGQQPRPRPKPRPRPDDGILEQGDRGPAVTDLKAKLQAWFDAASPREWETFRIGQNAIFGASLDRAVRVFQARVGIEIDGQVGGETRRALAAPPTPSGAAATPDLVLGAPLKRGDKGLKVRLAQCWLSLQGMHVVPDREFGPATQRAVRAFQGARGLRVTGVVDDGTYAALTAPMTAALARLAAPGQLAPLVVAYARQHLAQHPLEVGGQNAGPWVRLYTDGQEGERFPWCAGFATFVLEQACGTLGVPLPVARTLSCDGMATSAGTRLVRGTDAGVRSRVGPGSFFLQRSRTAAERAQYRYRHTGIIVGVDSETLSTIEGNTNDDGSAEGYEVCARTRGYDGMDFVVL